MDTLLKPWFTEHLLACFLVLLAILALAPKPGWRGLHYAAFVFAVGCGLLSWFTVSFDDVEFGPLIWLVEFPFVVTGLAAASLVLGFSAAFLYGAFGLSAPRAASPHLFLVALALSAAFFLGYRHLLTKAWALEVETRWDTVPTMIGQREVIKISLTAGAHGRGMRALYRTTASTEEVVRYYEDAAPREGWILFGNGFGLITFCKANYTLILGAPGYAGDLPYEELDPGLGTKDIASVSIGRGLLSLPSRPAPAACR